MRQYSGVWVYAEHRNGIVGKSTLELLGKGRELAGKLGVELSAVLFGHNVIPLAESLTEYGADRVYVADDENLANYNTLTYSMLMTELIMSLKPEIVLFTASTIGRDLAPRVAARLGTGLTANCIDLDIGDFEDKETGIRCEKILYQIVPAFGGNVVATIVTPYNRPQMATVRPGTFPIPEKLLRKGEIIVLKARLRDEETKVKVLESNRRREESGLENAKIIVGGGLGIGGPEGVEILKDLADALGGCLGATRPVTDAKWMPQNCMIGESGKTVRPELYVACGISGALHHMIGVRGSRRIVAINSDPKAPIFEAADYIVIGDLFEIVPRLTEKVKKHVGAL